VSARNGNVSASRTARVASVAALALVLGTVTAQGVRWESQHPASGTVGVAGVRWETVAPNGVRWETTLAGARSVSMPGVQSGPIGGVRTDDGVRWE
jgi:hypothetical protein